MTTDRLHSFLLANVELLEGYGINYFEPLAMRYEGWPVASAAHRLAFWRRAHSDRLTALDVVEMPLIRRPAWRVEMAQIMCDAMHSRLWLKRRIAFDTFLHSRKVDYHREQDRKALALDRS